MNTIVGRLERGRSMGRGHAVGDRRKMILPRQPSLQACARRLLVLAAFFAAALRLEAERLRAALFA